jgi:hypothetical protein
MRKALMLAIVAAGLLVSLFAQAQRGGGMGGGRGGGMGGGGMGGGRGAVGHGPAASGRPAPAMTAGRFAGASAHSRMVANNGRFINGRFGVNNHTVFVNGHHHCLNGFNCRNRFFFNSAFGFPGFGWGYPYNYIPGFYPTDYNQEPQQPQQPVVVSNENEGNTQLAVEIQRLSDEISYMRQQQAQQARPGTSLSAHSAEATTFVFRDGRRMTTENYAIAGQTLWVFNERIAKKFPISDLDRAATEQTNAENGVDVRLP